MISKDFEQKDGQPAGPLTPQSAPAWVLWHHHRLGITHGVVLPQAQSTKTEAPISPSFVHADPDPMMPHAQESWAPTAPSEPCIEPTAPSHHHNVIPTPAAPLNQSKGMPRAPLNPAEKEAALQNLSQRMNQFKDLSIAQSAENMVFADGNPHSSIMLVGEAPGAEEDRQGRPFVGASGTLLDAMMASIGLNRTQLYIANVVAWRPAFNRQPSAQEIATCLPFLHEHIHIIQPRVIICVGGVAAKALLCLDQTLTQTQGQELAYQCPIQSRAITAFTLYHPAYLMRSPGQKKVAWQQLLYIQGFLKSIGLDHAKEQSTQPSD